MRLWDADGRFKKVLGTKTGSFPTTPKIDFSPDNRWLVAADGNLNAAGGGNLGGAVVWSVPDGKQVSRFDHHDNTVFRATFASSGRHGHLIASTGGNKNDIFLWDAATGRQVGHIVGRGGNLFAVAISPDGRRFAWGWTNRGTKFNLQDPLTTAFDFLEVKRIKGQELSAVDGWQRGRKTSGGYAARSSAELENTLIIHRNGRETARVARSLPYDQIVCYAFLPRRRQVVVGSEFGLTLHDADSGATLREFVGHTGTVNSVAVSPDGQTLFSASGDQTLRLWDLSGDGQVTIPKPREVVSATNIKWLSENGYAKYLDAPDGLDQLKKLFLADSNVAKFAHLFDFTPRVSPLLNFFFTRDGEDFVAWTDEGYYMASPGGKDLIGWHTNRGIDKPADFASASQYAKVFNRPDVIEHVLTARSTEKALEMAAEAARTRVDAVVDVRRDQDRLAVPKIHIVTPERSSRVSGETIRLSGYVEQTGTLPIQDVRITVNKRPISDRKGVGVRPANAANNQPQNVPFEVDVPLLPGSNLIEVVASTAFAISQPAGVEVVRESGTLAKPTLHVLGIAVAEYEQPRLRLSFPDNDIRGTVEVLKGQKGRLYEDVVVKELIDSEVTDRNIRRAMSELKDRVKQQDVAVVIISGHGYSHVDHSFYFCPYDFDPDEPTITGYRFSNLTEPLAQLRGKVLLLMDTCHSGGAIETPRTRRAKSIHTAVDLAIQQLTSVESGVVVMTSSTGSELSFEDDAWGHGAFALSVIEALSGNRKGPASTVKLPADLNLDRLLELTELDAYVTARVRELTDGQQRPLTERGRIPSFPLAVSD